MSGDDKAETELGLAADAPTEFRDPVPIDVQQAWSVDNDIGDLQLHDGTHASWRRVATIVGAITAAAGIVAGGIVAWDRHSQPPPAAPESTHSAPAPESAPPWHLSGTYRLDIQNPQGTLYRADGTAIDMSDFRSPARSNWLAYQTGCKPAGCTARSVLLDDVTHQNADNLDADLARHWRSTMRWNGTEWATAGDGPHGGSTDTLVECDQTGRPDSVETWLTLSPLPDGSFRGTTYKYVMTNECGMLGDRYETPVVAVRIGDIPPGVEV